MQHKTYFPTINHFWLFTMQALNMVKDEFLDRYVHQTWR